MRMNPLGLSVVLFIAISYHNQHMPSRTHSLFPIALLLLLGPICVFYIQGWQEDVTPTVEQLLAGPEYQQHKHLQGLFRTTGDPLFVSLEGVFSAQDIHQVSHAFSQLDGVERVEYLSALLSRNSGDNANVWLLNLTAKAQTVPGARDLLQAMQESAGIGNTRLSVLGLSQMRVASRQVVQNDLRRMLPLMIAAITVIPVLFVPMQAAILFPLAVAVISCSLLLLLLQLVEGGIGHLSLLLLPLVWAIATLDAMHLLDRTGRHRLKGNLQPTRSAIRDLRLPCLMTSLTTAAACLILAIQEASPLLSRFGLWAGIGALTAYLVTFLIGGLYTPVPGYGRSPGTWTRGVPFTLVSLAQRYCAKTRWLWLTLGLLCLPGLSALETDIRFPDLFADSSPLTAELRQLQGLTGTDLRPLDLVLEASDQAGSEPPALLHAARAVINYARSWPETRMLLPADLIQNDTATLPHNPNQAEKALATLLAQHPDADSWLNPDQGAVRIQLHLAPHTMQRKTELLGWLEAFDRQVLRHHQLAFGGTGFTFHRVQQQGGKAALRSWLGSTLIILLMIALVIRRRLGVVIAGAVAILLPLLMLLGVMGYLGIPWGLSLMLLPILYVGLAVDDLLHLLWPLRGYKGATNTAVRAGALKAGPAIVASSLVLAACTAALGFSDLQVMRQLALLLPVGILLALFSSLTLLPALLSPSSHKSARQISSGSPV